MGLAGSNLPVRGTNMEGVADMVEKKVECVVVVVDYKEVGRRKEGGEEDAAFLGWLWSKTR